MTEMIINSSAVGELISKIGMALEGQSASEALIALGTVTAQIMHRVMAASDLEEAAKEYGECVFLTALSFIEDNNRTIN
jgi:hypothetical protein